MTDKTADQKRYAVLEKKSNLFNGNIPSIVKKHLSTQNLMEEMLILKQNLGASLIYLQNEEPSNGGGVPMAIAS